MDGRECVNASSVRIAGELGKDFKAKKQHFHYYPRYSLFQLFVVILDNESLVNQEVWINVDSGWHFLLKVS